MWQEGNNNKKVVTIWVSLGEKVEKENYHIKFWSPIECVEFKVAEIDAILL